jgi:hypothetical protein
LGRNWETRKNGRDKGGRLTSVVFESVELRVALGRGGRVERGDGGYRHGVTRERRSEWVEVGDLGEVRMRRCYEC